MSNNHSNTLAETFRHIRKDPVTGQENYLFPLEITDPSIRALAQERGLEISRTRLGYRVFDAVMVPCKDTALIHGVEVYVDTPTDVQRRKYLDLIKDELDRQEEMKQDGRCDIPAVNGGLKKCPRRVPNPDYVPGGNQPKTIAKKCDGCPFERFKHAHTVIELSCLDHEGDDGEVEAYEVPAPRSSFAGDRYEELAEAFVAFVREKKPKLAALAELKVDELNLTEAAKELGKAISTVDSQTKKLQELLIEFLDTAIVF